MNELTDGQISKSKAPGRGKPTGANGVLRNFTADFGNKSGILKAMVPFGGQASLVSAAASPAMGLRRLYSIKTGTLGVRSILELAKVPMGEKEVFSVLDEYLGGSVPACYLDGNLLDEKLTEEGQRWGYHKLFQDSRRAFLDSEMDVAVALMAEAEKRGMKRLAIAVKKYVLASGQSTSSSAIELRKLNTKERHAEWHKAYKKIKGEYPDQPNTWIAKKIKKEQHGTSKTPSVDTIRKNMTPPPEK